MPNHDIDVIILAGGLGTRLRPVLPDTQKVFAPVTGEPFVFKLLTQLKRDGFTRVTLALGHRAEDALPHLPAWSEDFGITIAASIESTPLGTGGAARLACLTATSDTMLVLNGDSYVDADLAALCRAHATCSARATLCTVYVEDIGRFGWVRWDPSTHEVIAFEEKSAAQAGQPGWINAGIYLLRRADLLQCLPANTASSLERDLLPRLVGGHLHAFPVRAPFIDIGLPETYRASTAFFSPNESSKST